MDKASLKIVIQKGGGVTHLVSSVGLSHIVVGYGLVVQLVTACGIEVHYLEGYTVNP